MATHIIFKGISIHGIPTVHYGAVKTLKKQKQIKIKVTMEVSCQIPFQTVNKSTSPSDLVAPALSSSQLGLQTFVPCPALLSVPYLCHAAPAEPEAHTVVCAWEGMGSCGGTVVWDLVAVAVVVLVVIEAALRTEGGRCWGPLWCRVCQDLQYRYKVCR